MIKDLNPNEKRDYNRFAKKRQRAKEKAASEAKGEALRTPDAWSYQLPLYRQAQLEKLIAETMTKISEETDIQGYAVTELDTFVIDAIVSVKFGFENSIGPKVVTKPDGMFVGGKFPDAAASNAIEHIHRFPNILQSKTFAQMYWTFLELVHKWSRVKKNEQYADVDFMRDINAELSRQETK
jgi:hypothetical protein